MNETTKQFTINLDIKIYKWLSERDETVSFLCKYLMLLYVDGFITKESLLTQKITPEVEKHSFTIRCNPKLHATFKEMKVRSISNTLTLLGHYYKTHLDNL